MADEYREPARVQGAWLIDGETRMDDQQHALSALLRTVPIAEGGADVTGATQSPAAWLWVIALFAGVNPFRLALALPRGDRPARVVTGVAALGGIVGAAIVLLMAVVGGGPLLSVLDVSEPAMRIAAGVAAAVIGVVTLVVRHPSPTPALPGLGSAAVPVAVPMVANAGLIMLAISAYADRGATVVAAALLIPIGVLALAATFVPSDGVPGRVLDWFGRLTAAALVLTAAQLVIDGLFAV
jgi:small neutral amino acid transporter SnatA (MarC family)